MKLITKITSSSVSRFGEVPDEVTGIAYSHGKKTVVFFCHDNGDVGFVVDGLIQYAPKRLELPSPVGMTSDADGIYMAQFAPVLLWQYEKSMSYSHSMCGRGVWDRVSMIVRFARSRHSLPIEMCRAGSNIVMAMPFDHKVVSIGPASADVLLGNGRPGFAVSGNLKATMLSEPSGVCFDRARGMLLVADTGNGVVRRIMSKEETPLGMPGDRRVVNGNIGDSRFESPSILCMCGRRIIVADGMSVRAIDQDGGTVSTVYLASKRILSMAASQSDLFVLEGAS